MEGCQRELHELRKRFETADAEVERERERWKTERDESERVQNEMRSQTDELKCNLRQSHEKIEELKQKQKVQSNFWACFWTTTNQKNKNTETFCKLNFKLRYICLQDVQSTHGDMAAELNGLLAERDENHQRIKELKQDAATLTQQKLDIEAELDR